MIHITDNYYCNVDSNGNYIIVKDQHKKDKKGNDIYVTFGYYQSLSTAIIGLKRIIDADELSSINCELNEAIKIINDNNVKFTTILKETINE